MPSLEPDSKYSSLDTNGDNIVSDQEFQNSERQIRLNLLKNQDQKEDSLLLMCWLALGSMLFYPPLIIFSEFIGMERAAGLVAEISSIYFLSVGGLVSVFFGSQAIIKKNGK